MCASFTKINEHKLHLWFTFRCKRTRNRWVDCKKSSHKIPSGSHVGVKEQETSGWSVKRVVNIPSGSHVGVKEQETGGWSVKRVVTTFLVVHM